MKVLNISLNKDILNFESATARRMLDYAGLVDEMSIIVLGTGGEVIKKDNLTVYPTSKNKIKSILKALEIGREILNSDMKKEYLISTQDPFFTGLVGYWLKNKFKTPLQIQVHLDFFNSFFKRESLKNRGQGLIANFLLPKADCVRVVSTKIKKYLNTKLEIPEKKIFILPIYTNIQEIISYQPGVDLHKKYPNFDFIILMASRLVKSKNIDLAISALRNILSKHPNAGLVIVGSGPEETKLKRGSRDIHKNIVFEKWTDDLVSYYKTADLFLTTSFYEGWGRTAIEAMASGCPVLVSDTGLVGEVIESDYNGLVFKIGDDLELVEKVQFAIENSDEINELKIHALETVKRLPTKEEYLKEYKKSWQNCLS